MTSFDVIQERVEITKIHRFDFLSKNILMCIFKLDSKFAHEGLTNNDLPIFTSIFKSR